MLKLPSEERKHILETTINPLNYPEQYFLAIEKEKSYRNLENFDHLFNVTNIEIDYKPLEQSSNVISAPKHQIPYEFNFKALFKKFEIIFKDYRQYIFICGGAALNYYFLTNYELTIDMTDIDLFISVNNSDKISDIHKDIIRELFKYPDMIINFKESKDAISFTIKGDKDIKVQIIKRLYNSPSEIIHGFDIDCSCILLTLTDYNIYVTERCLNALETQCNYINFERLSPSYEHRIFKYYERGFSIYIPFGQFFRDNFVTNFRTYEKLQGSVLLYYKLLSTNYNFKNVMKYYSDYESKDESLLTIEDVDNIVFKTLNPNEQSNNTFNQIILEDIKNWYTDIDFITFELPQKYLQRGDYKTITFNDLIDVNYREFYCYRSLKYREFKNPDFLVNFLKIFNGNVVAVGDLPLQILTKQYLQSVPKKITLCCINSDDLYNLIKQIEEYCYQLNNDMISWLEPKDVDFLASSIISENDFDMRLKESKMKSKKQFYDIEYNYLVDDKPRTIRIRIYICNFNNYTDILDTTGDRYVDRLILDQYGNFITDSLGEFYVKNRVSNIAIYNFKPLDRIGVCNIDTNIVENQIDIIYKKNLNDKFKLYGNPRDISQLVGPNTFVFYKNFGNNKSQRILILGENHTVNGLPKEVDDKTSFEIHMWLYKLSKISPECLDIFLETNNRRIVKNPLKNKNLKDFSSPIESIANVFSVCTNNDCFTNSVRYHLIDARVIDTTESIFHYLVNAQIYYKLDLTSQIISGENFGRAVKISLFYNIAKKTNGYRIMEYYSGKDSSEDNKQILKEYYEIVSKNTKYENDFELYEKYREEYMKKINKAISKIEQPFDLDKFYDTLIQCYITLNFTFFDSLVCIPMDVYFLLRYLQTYTKLERGPSNCTGDDYKIAKNSIIHAGDGHSTVYVEFFRQWYEIEPTLSIINPYTTQYIDFETPFDFFQS